ncbi:MAG TPA: Rieske 2Fe-2S domain-containing protein [Actinomycetes bacterium]|jgi:nitrite reductase/ring-hydroxylating ferredoxin subunit
MKLFESVTLLENAGALDRAVTPLRAAVRKALGSGRARDMLHGVWLGHPLHPSLVQMSIGTFLSAGLLDALPGQERAARVLIGAGLVSAAPSAASGWADWSETHEQQQRVGLVHAAANVLALGMYAGSLAERSRGHAGRGKALAYAGLSVLGVSGFIGGHMSFRQAAGANHGEDVPHLVRPGWHDLCALDDLAGDGVPQRQVLEGAEPLPLLVVRQGDRIDVLSDRCSHLSGPLHEGEVTGGGECITCPWHGSTFSLDDGSVRGGPATAPVHAFDVRVASGRVLVRLPGAG